MASKQRVVSKADWLKARKKLLVKEKKFLRQQDAMSADRRSLPWVKVTKPYLFEGPNGEVPFSELFNGCSQLIIYHFMFTSKNEAGCPHCSLRADGFNGINVHLKHRDVTMIAVSRAPFARIVVPPGRSSSGRAPELTVPVGAAASPVTPGASTASSAILRPFNGSSLIARCVMT